jgi:hypothetical protein
MYREYYSQKEWDEIAHGKYGGKDTFPHCNQTFFHAPGICPFCDGYYYRNPGFVPSTYVEPEANGWGGNQAPKLDDEKARQEQEEWDEYMRGMASGEYELKEREWVRENVARMLKFFVREPKNEV